MFGKNATRVTLGPSQCFICLPTDVPFDHLVKVSSKFPLMINKCFMGKYLETVQISCFL